MVWQSWEGNDFRRLGKGLLTLGIRLAGDAIEEMDDLGNPIIDDSFLLLLNAYHASVPLPCRLIKRA